MRLRVLLGALGLGVVSMAAMADDARACGGCFHGPTQNGDVITDHRMIFSVSPQQTTLYDEIEYQGSPAGFAWVLPIHGQVQVALSADVLFASLDAATQTTIESPPPPTCASCSCEEFGGPSAGGGSSGSSSGGDNGGVTVISQSVVGPYDSVQLQSTNPTALSDWLTANGFAIPADVQPIIAAYVNEGFDFLALKLQPGQGVQAMRPVSVTTSGAGLSLPLRMVSAGTGATVGITLWVVADGRYEAANFPNFTVDPSKLVWDFNTETSNYTTVVQQKESAASFATWQTESSLDLSPYQIENAVLTDDAATDYLAIPAGDAGPGETADEVRQNDLATLFPGVRPGDGPRHAHARRSRPRRARDRPHAPGVRRSERPVEPLPGHAVGERARLSPGAESLSSLQQREQRRTSRTTRAWWAASAAAGRPARRRPASSRSGARPWARTAAASGWSSSWPASSASPSCGRASARTRTGGASPSYFGSSSSIRGTPPSPCARYPYRARLPMTCAT